ncbi:MAG: SprT family zinc-dependent metalloprotease [Candidatus Saccharimonadales bacterium]
MQDEEFGTITVHRSAKASSIRISVGPDGTLRASLPLYAPLFMLRRLVKSSRSQLRKMLETQTPVYKLENGMQIGKSHKLVTAWGSKTSVRRSGQHIIVHLAEGETLDSPAVERMVRDTIITALRVESKSYLPKRLAFLADQLDCRYEKVRFSHASSRWGSCSSTGTISLNIALMTLPFELIDYVIIHELCHTKQMNHSTQFWRLVENEDPSYKLHRSMLKRHSPTL